MYATEWGRKWLLNNDKLRYFLDVCFVQKKTTLLTKGLLNPIIGRPNKST